MATKKRVPAKVKVVPGPKIKNEHLPPRSAPTSELLKILERGKQRNGADPRPKSPPVPSDPRDTGGRVVFPNATPKPKKRGK